jgi:integrase
MLALRFADVDFKRGLIVLRGETTKSKKTRLVPIRHSASVRFWSGCGSTLRASRARRDPRLQQRDRRAGFQLALPLS